jgi:HTH-type transcriptional regulator / antitoxin HigA
MEGELMRRVAKKLKDLLPTDFEDLVRVFPPRPIHDEVGYENAQEMIDALVALPKRSKGQSEYLETLSILFGAYEKEAHPIETSDLTPVTVLKQLLEEHAMSASDLGRLCGERSLGVKILRGQRDLSKSHIRKLAEYFGVSADLFL